MDRITFGSIVRRWLSPVKPTKNSVGPFIGSDSRDRLRALAGEKEAIRSRSILLTLFFRGLFRLAPLLALSGGNVFARD